MISRATLDSAFKRFCNDVSDRSFYAYPATLPVVRANSDDWLDQLAERMNDKAYRPDPALVLEVPKPSWHVRMGSVLSLEDQVAYSAIGLDLLSSVESTIGWSSPEIRHSHRLASADSKKYWFHRKLVGWKAFDRESIKRLKGRSAAKYVVVADIAGFYDNIDIGRLVRELRGSGAKKETTTILSTCLNQWAQQRGRGIPQGHSVSDLLAEFFLDPVDKQLRLEQFDHLRYNDDIRIFTRTEREARQAIRFLTRRMHERGLNLQSAKTQVLKAAAAKKQFGNVQDWLKTVDRKLTEAMTRAGSTDYVSARVLGAHLRADPESPAPEVVEGAWEEFASRRRFDKTIFHYLINRLGDMTSDMAVDYCLGALAKYPQETSHILNYLRRLPSTSRKTDRIGALLHSNDTIYDYQCYQITHWAWENDIADDRILDFCRRSLRHSNTSLRAQCLLYVGRYGETSDIDAIQRQITQSTDRAVRAAAVCSLKTLSKDQKGSILARARGQDSFLDWCVDWAQS